MGNIIFIHKVIDAMESKIQERVAYIRVDGKRTPPRSVKEIRRVLSDASFRIAREHNVLVNWPHMSICGKKVELGDATIMLPNGKYVSYPDLKMFEIQKEREIKEMKAAGRSQRKGGRRRTG